MEPRVLSSIEAVADFAGELLADLSARTDGKATVIALSGDLGAGKTAFVKSLAKHLGVAEHITSPTFVIMKKYPVEHEGFKELVHIDAYRMKDAHELEVLGWGELIYDPKNLIAIEWPELVESAVPDHAIKLTFAHVDATTRSVLHAK